MSSRPPTASYENFSKTLKGLRRIVPPGLLAAQLARFELAAEDARRSRVPLLRIKALTDALADEMRDPLLIVRAFSYLNYRPAFLRKTFLPGAYTLSDAIALLQRYMHVGTDLGQIEIETRGPHTVLRLKPNPAADASAQQLDAMLYGLLRTLLNCNLQAVDNVAVPHTPPADQRNDYQALFPAPVLFDTGYYGFRFPVVELSRALGWAHDANRVARRERKLIRLDADHPWAESVETLLTVLLRNGDGSIDRCAALLAVSRRTLQRRIEADGVTFLGLREDSRKRLAVNYLARGYSCETVALLIGYRQVSQFYRSFRAWFGASPKQYRLRLPALRATTAFAPDARPRLRPSAQAGYRRPCRIPATH